VPAKVNKSLVPRRWCPVGTKKEKGRFGVGAGLRGQIPDRPPILKGSVGPSKAPLAYRPTSSLPNPPGQVKRKKKGRFGVGAELRGQVLDRPPIRRGSVGPSKAPLAYRPTSSLPNPPGQVSAFKEFVVQVGIVRAARVPSPTWLRPNANTEEEPRYAH
jgi:hypothetical protein